MSHFKDPTHIYSHQSGTFLDDILDSIDMHFCIAHLCRWSFWSMRKKPTPCFVVNGAQHHDVSTHIERETTRVYCRTCLVEHNRRDPTLHVYATLVMEGKLTWREHCWCVALRHDVCPSTPW